MMESIGYTKNPRSHRRISLDVSFPLIEWVEHNFRNELNLVGDDPFDFDRAHHRYDAESNKVGVNV